MPYSELLKRIEASFAQQGLMRVIEARIAEAARPQIVEACRDLRGA